LTYFLFFFGFFALLMGAKWLVDGAASVGKRFGLPQIIIGLTIVAFGTSLPELVINVFASFKGSTDLAIGNVIGSNIMNTLLVIGVAAIIYPISMTGKKGLKDAYVNLFATLVLLVIANFSFIGESAPLVSRYDGIFLLLLLTAFLVYTFRKDGALEEEAKESGIRVIAMPLSVLFIVIGSLGLFFGGKWIVDGVHQISQDLGLSESVVGLTIVATATSLPELVTSVIAAMKKNTDLAVGNAIGSNLFNILLVLGVSAIINPISYDTSLNSQLYILIAASVLIIIFILVDYKKTNKFSVKRSTRVISRLEGIVLIGLYIVFLFISLKK
jgi:cation:H+ antiporter